MRQLKLGNVTLNLHHGVIFFQIVRWFQLRNQPTPSLQFLTRRVVPMSAACFAAGIARQCSSVPPQLCPAARLTRGGCFTAGVSGVRFTHGPGTGATRDGRSVWLLSLWLLSLWGHFQCSILLSLFSNSYSPVSVSTVTVVWRAL